MKQWICLLLLLAAGRLTAQNITAAEYFFNTDPGAGQATPLAVGTPAAAVQITATIPTTSLSSGFHTLAIRAKNADNQWGLLEMRTVYVSQTATNVPPIVAAECFFDKDPGAGNGTGLGVTTPGHSVQFSAVIPTTSLQPGFHQLVIRTKDAAGIWGLFEVRGFYLYAVPANAAAITAAEYYVDNDPGTGNGTPVNIGGSGGVVSFALSLPTSSLSSGFHTLSIRAKDASGNWGLVETRGFYLQPAGANMGAVTAAEYFLDDDPGVGNGMPLTIATPGTSVSQNFMIEIPRGTANGPHLLGIRVKDAAGVWGLFELREINVSGFPLPLHWLSFTGRRKDNTVALLWTTANEINTSHFEVERSVNGVKFNRIGQTTANGGVQNNYQFTDAAPAKGLNFYRLRQVDKNGAFNYSAVVKVYFGDADASTLNLFPQPVSSELNVVFGGRGAEVMIQVYDATGKIVVNERKQNNSVIRLPVEKLARGNYWIVVSDGVTQQKGQFVKQ